jgi:Cu2+-containing amine oxidase
VNSSFLNPLEHEKKFQKIKDDSNFKVKKKIIEKKNFKITISLNSKEYKFLNDLSVDLTSKYKKIFNRIEVLRLIFAYVENFQHEFPLFYEVTRK